MDGRSIVDIVGLTEEGNTYCCKDCQTHLALSDDVVSKSFHTMNGRAYLFNNVKLSIMNPRSTKKGNLYLKGRHRIWHIRTNDWNKILGPDGRNSSNTPAVQIDRLQIAAEENS